MLIQVLIVVYLAFLGFFFFRQEHLVFQPSETPKGLPRDCSYLDSQNFIKTKEANTPLYVKTNSADTLVIFYHENKGTVCNLKKLIPMLELEGDGDLVLVEYGSYADVSIKHSLGNLKKDVTAVISYVEKSNKNYTKVIVTGWGTGSAVASYHIRLDKTNIDKAILISPFPTYLDVIKHKYWYLPVKYLFRHNLLTDFWLQKSTIPILAIAGAENKVIPERYSRTLSEKFDNVEYKVFKGLNSEQLKSNAKVREAFIQFAQKKP